MWLLEGRYTEDSCQELSKLLKCGETYTLGRKIPAAILVDSKFVSRTSCHITIGNAPAYPTELDPATLHTDEALRPKVTIRFEASKRRQSFGVMQAPRNGAKDASPVEVQVAANQDFVLHDQDSFALTTTISLKLVWRPIAVCFAGRIKEPAIAPLRSASTSFGLFLSPAKAKWRNGFTHLCLQQVRPTESVLQALLQAKPIVKLDYLGELIRRGNLPRYDPEALETNFPDLDLATYQPDIDQDELSGLADLPSRILPNPKRTYMLQGTTFVFFVLPSNDTEFAIYKRVLSVAGARVISHNPEIEHLTTKSDFAHVLMPHKGSALTYWRNSGTKARSEAPDEGLVVLCSNTYDDADWKIACTVACSKLKIAMPPGFHAISNAVFSADAREHLNIFPANPEAELDSSPPPASVHNTQDVTRIEETARIPPQNDANIHKASNGNTAAFSDVERLAGLPAVLAQETMPVDLLADAADPPARRPLKRRTQRATTEEDRSAVAVNRADSLEEHSYVPAAASSQMESAASSKPRSRLTRRTGTDRQASRRSDVFDALLRQNDGAAEDMANDNDAASSAVDLNGGASSSSVPRSRRFRMQLDEQDKAESQVDSQSADIQPIASEQASAVAGQKRKQTSAAGAIEDTDRAKRTRRAPTAEPELPSQSQVVIDDDMQEPPPTADQVIRREPSDHAAGLSSGAQPDTEPQFLQALNTQRAKGKRMDAFDAEFNNLRIARPNQLNDREAAKHSSNFLPTGQARRQQEQSQAAQRPPDEDFEAFKKMAQEELRIHVRGNFVQVDFVPLIHHKDPRPTTNTAPNDVPNFKKFRPKGKATQSAQNGARAKAAVSMILTKTNDYGLGDAYWKDKNSATVLDDDPGGDRAQNGARPRVLSGQQKQRRTSVVDLALSDDSADFSPVGARGCSARHSPILVEDSEVDELQSSGGFNLGLDGMDSIDELDDADITTLQQRQKATTRAQQRAASKPTKTLPRPARGAKRAAPVVRESDDEEEARATSKRPAMALDLDDDDDDDDDDYDNGNFAGFGKTTSARSSCRVPAPRAPAARRGRSAF